MKMKILMAAGTFFPVKFFFSGKTLCYVLFFAGMYVCTTAKIEFNSLKQPFCSFSSRFLKVFQRWRPPVAAHVLNSIESKTML
jgi:hypothetical protein